MSDVMNVAGLDGIDTPAPVVDLEAVERNLARAQIYYDAHGIRLPEATLSASSWRQYAGALDALDDKPQAEAARRRAETAAA